MNARQAVAVAAASLVGTLAQAQTPLRVIVFPGGANLPLWVAEDKGLFAREKLATKITNTPGSVFLVQSLMKGDQDVALTLFDNVVAYQEGQGEAKLETQPDLFTFMAFTQGTVRLVVNPEIKTYADLRGKALGVDAVSTGLAFTLRKLLQIGGLAEGDYKLVPAGGTAQRAEQLMQNKFDGTLLYTPLELAPEARGYRRLANLADVLGPYQAISGVARQSWASGNRDALVGFVRAAGDAMEWLYDPKNRAEAVAIYRKYLPNVPEAAAPRHVEAMLGEREGWVRSLRLESPGMETVLKIRSEFGRPQKTLTDPSRYVDESYLRAARPR